MPRSRKATQKKINKVLRKGGTPTNKQRGVPAQVRKRAAAKRAAPKKAAAALKRANAPKKRK